MRGSHGFCDADVRVMGIIPAHAGLTRKKKALKYGDRDHPRACGAHVDCRVGQPGFAGSSPRMRGSRGIDTTAGCAIGIIPAHAGLTNSSSRTAMPRGDHPRACGAHRLSSRKQIAARGSSPRMRGSRKATRRPYRWTGIIPAHAGLTFQGHRGNVQARDHPRACGAHKPCRLYGIN